jgi:hypothetical protein
MPLGSCFAETAPKIKPASVASTTRLARRRSDLTRLNPAALTAAAQP